MAMSTRINLRQTQSMTMTPQLLQSIKLLQFTQTELEQFVDSQIENNPLLERAGPLADEFVEQNQDEKTLNSDSHWENSDLEISAAQISDKLDTSLENVFPDDPGNGNGAILTQTTSGNRANTALALPSMGTSDDEFSLENVAQEHLSLRDVVEEQIPFICSSVLERAIALELTDALDERGYVEFDLVAMADRLGCGGDTIRAVLDKMQTCDPAGVFARDLAECLVLQCKRIDRYDPAMQALLENLDLLAKRDFNRLSQICGVGQADLIDMLAEIKRLDPKPGLAFEMTGTQAVVHDVDVSQAPDGTWRIELNTDALPRVIVDRQYYAEISRVVNNKEEKTFVADCLANATWLERSLDQRATTILKVATEIVRQQDAFLVEGVSGLKPMTMKSIADAINMHESTISRVASNKYMLTPRGIFELRYFFTVAIAGTDNTGEQHSSESVRQRIKELIENESVTKVLSDDGLVDALKAEGIDIARRTVAKYRENMNIASSVQRRREKKARAASGELVN